jgi:hypothetical protein
MQAQIDQGLESKRPTIPLSNILKNQELKSHLAQLWDEGKKLIFSKKEL